ncbi:Clp protease N-terminal domain-containing protein [Streptomyces canus]|uniref:Clp protease N-terminal domain-containing protein n=1 Tax=Streptomyces canus TaxID=58343 RepID=UPI0038008C81
MTDELREAMVHVKQAAVHHRNNCIGTEHLLWGLTTEVNSATRLLRAAGVSPDAVHRSAGTRLSMGHPSQQNGSPGLPAPARPSTSPRHDPSGTAPTASTATTCWSASPRSATESPPTSWPRPASTRPPSTPPLPAPELTDTRST